MNKAFTKRILVLRGAKGKKWLEDLPEVISSCEKKWDITCFNPFSLSYNYVAPAETNDGIQVVLKISFPENKEFLSEIETLRFYNGEGAIRILEEDITNGIILLERAVPDTRIGDVSPDSEQIGIVSKVTKEIHKPISKERRKNLPLLKEWAKAFERYQQTYSINSGLVPKEMFERTKDIFMQDSSDSKDEVLLHGDLHNDNILLSSRGWLAIDPKGIIGHRAFDVGTYLRNPITDLPENSDYKKILINRVAQFSDELQIEKKVIWNWTLANAVISSLWFLEDEGKVDQVYLDNVELIAHASMT